MVDGTYNFSEPLVDWIWYEVTEDFDRPLTSHRLDDLVPDSFYELQVIAVNDLGRSDVESLFIFSTAADGLLQSLFVYRAAQKILSQSQRER